MTLSSLRRMTKKELILIVLENEKVIAKDNLDVWNGMRSFPQGKFVYDFNNSSETVQKEKEYYKIKLEKAKQDIKELKDGSRT